MKNITVGGYEKRDIQQQVAKVLRDLGKPDPPLHLEDVRELLKLDLQYYRSGDDDAVKEFVSKVKIGFKQIVQRPTLLWDVIRKAKLSALWVPDRKRILVDANAPKLKHRWYEAHEINHSITPWHQQFLLGDTEKELNPWCLEVIEAEANYGAGQLLFLQDRFTAQAMDMPLSLGSVQKIAKEFGNTITSTLWRFVEEACSEISVVALVSAHPHYLDAAEDPSEPCRRCIESPKFKVEFGHLTEMELFGMLSSYCSFRKRGPLGEDELILTDANGEAHFFHFESFSNGFDVLTLAVHERKVGAVVGF